MDNIFETASRNKVRFSGVRGNLSVEDLWDLSFQQLDDMYAGLDEVAQKDGVKHLMDECREDDGTALKMALIERVFTVKVEERNAQKQRAEDRAALKRLMEIKARNKNAAEEELDPVALDAMISELKQKLS